MFQKIFAGLLALTMVGTAVADSGWSVVLDQTKSTVKVVSVVKTDQATPFLFGPVVFFGHRLSKNLADHELTMLEPSYLKGGFVPVPGMHPGRQFTQEYGVGGNVITSQIAFAGSVSDFKLLVDEGGDGSELNVKGAAQTAIGSALMAVGALFSNQWLGVIGMTASGNSSEFGSFIKDDPTWFKSVGEVPANTELVVVLRSWIDRRDENDDWKRVIVYTTIFSDSELSKDRLAELVVTSYKPLLKPQPLTEKQREWLDRNGWANLKVR